HHLLTLRIVIAFARRVEVSTAAAATAAAPTAAISAAASASATATRSARTGAAAARRRFEPRRGESELRRHLAERLVQRPATGNRRPLVCAGRPRQDDAFDACPCHRQHTDESDRRFHVSTHGNTPAISKA